MKISFNINGTPQSLEVEGNTPLLWVIRDVLNLKGTKFGCGKAACGACTIHVDGEAVRSCSFAAKFAEGKNITTIEGLSSGDDLHPVQQAWIEEVVPQCGYCQPGFMMATAALLEKVPDPSDKDIDDNIVNICRCATHYRIRKAIHRAAEIQTNNI
ncbi:MAG: (2Fe-2S)-binding protein [Lewinellaceae bacterium]|nr:(2Fe-2S)-binding protein [Phaeodactylibacter sp.]MCB9347200.1 (2Fe-2S)-binding protein [Lewinellaceae bacterium]